MKNVKKILALVLVAVMMMALSVSAFAAGTGTITINVPQTEQPTTTDTTYKIYKVFDADGDGTAISYKVKSNHSGAVPTGFIVDDGGNVYLGTSSDTATGAPKEFEVMVGGEKKYITPQTGELTETQIAAIASYVTEADLAATVTAEAGATSVTSEALPNGYYYITTTTGTAVTVSSTNPNVTVNDKNIIPKVVKSAGTEYDKDSLKAIAAVGTDQSFTAQITKTHGATNLVFEDTMTNMTYNGDVAITVSAGTAPTTAQAKVEVTANGFKVTFDNDYIAGLADGTVITLKYTGKITSDALSTNPAENKATLTSGNGNTSESGTVEVYNAKFSVHKVDGSSAAVAGAGFVIAKTVAGAEAGTTKTVYYKLANDKKSISWVDSIDDATENTSDATGAVPAFTGLADGTYTLIEKTVPSGYNKAADSTFTISAGDYSATNLEQESKVVNNAGSVLPSTGGIGTTIFYIIGGILLVGAGVVLVTRRKMGDN